MMIDTAQTSQTTVMAIAPTSTAQCPERSSPQRTPNVSTVRTRNGHRLFSRPDRIDARQQNRIEDELHQEPISLHGDQWGHHDQHQQRDQKSGVAGDLPGE